MRAFSRQTLYPFRRLVFSSFDHEQLRKLREYDDAHRKKHEQEANIGLLFNYSFPLTPNISIPWQEQVYPERRHKARTVSFSPEYVASTMNTIRPSSIHIWIGNFNDRARACAEKHRLDIYVWTFNEKHPRLDPSVMNFALKHKGDPHVHLITDFPKEIAEAVRPRSSPGQAPS
jgi:glycerophosphoryl diester phosphodiesterase